MLSRNLKADGNRSAGGNEHKQLRSKFGMWLFAPFETR
jgi:hypothetical protein